MCCGETRLLGLPPSCGPLGGRAELIGLGLARFSRSAAMSRSFGVVLPATAWPIHRIEAAAFPPPPTPPPPRRPFAAIVLAAKIVSFNLPGVARCRIKYEVRGFTVNCIGV